MIARLLKWLLGELITDPKDGTVSHTRFGMLLAGMVFSVKMIVDLPDAWELWLVYLGTVGGYAVARQYVSAKAEQPPTPPAAEHSVVVQTGAQPTVSVQQP